ncbi:hypothetical protein RHSIM_Rhsim03G0059300 [Rhododendron simsii]|uniref:Uncharacterized protein n=1 Tax=Rhododendron simsii TaxID=118357 RepID=A0A834LRU4_RHOSS|nr:hypothetical protein RHSIM_Rhsim03G0059300 [Rhododendron simsii]
MVRKTFDLATTAGQALQMQSLAQDLSTSGLSKRKEQSEVIPIDQAEQTERPPATVTTDKPHAGRPRNVDDVEVLTTGLAEDDPANLNEPSAFFVPDFECLDGHVITVADSLEDSPLLAMILLKGLALPKDMDNLPTGKAKNMAKLCLLLAKAGQCAGKAFSDMDVLLETNRSLRVDLQAKRQEVEQSFEQIETLEAKSVEEENARLKKERAQLEEDLPKRLEEASDAGYNEAGEYYQQQVGLDYAEVPDADHRREPPVVPPLELPEIPPPEEQPNPTTD